MNITPRIPRWYKWENGTIIPCYEAPRNGKPGTKAYTLREAREDGALVSVTSVLSVIDKPQLDDWRVTQAISSALTLPRYPDEPLDSFADRVVIDMDAQTNKAAEFGVRIHDAIAEWLGNWETGKGVWQRHLGVLDKAPDMTCPIDLSPYLNEFYLWAYNNIEEVHAVEKVVGHRSLGIAGRLDLDCTIRGVGKCIVDWKSQNVQYGKAMFYDGWDLQLAAYAMATEWMENGPTAVFPDTHLMSVVIDSNAPGPIHTHLWENPGVSWKVFQSTLDVWIHTKGRGYNPRS